jgi:hypothetical protein
VAFFVRFQMAIFLDMESGFQAVHPRHHLTESIPKGVGQFIMIEIRELSGAFLAAFDDLTRDAHHDGIWRDGFDHHGIGSNPASGADFYCPQDLGACAHHNGIPQSGVPFAFFEAHAAQGDSVIESHVIPNFGGFSDDYPHPMVNEKAPPDICAGMDFDSSATSGEL